MNAVNKQIKFRSSNRNSCKENLTRNLQAAISRRECCVQACALRSRDDQVRTVGTIHNSDGRIKTIRCLRNGKRHYGFQVTIQVAVPERLGSTLERSSGAQRSACHHSFLLRYTRQEEKQGIQFSSLEWAETGSTFAKRKTQLRDSAQLAHA